MKYFLKCLYNYINFNGRARRKEFCFFVLYSIILIVLWCLALMGISFFLSAHIQDFYNNDDSIWVALCMCFINLFLAPPFIAVVTRRIHDIGFSFSKFFFLMLIIPVLLCCSIEALFNIDSEKHINEKVFIFLLLYLLIFLCLMIKKGTKGYNSFGPDPRIDDPIENSQKISGTGDDDFESHSSDNDSDPFAPKR